MVRLFEISNVEASIAPLGEQKIPRHIMQTFESRDVPPRMYEATRSWIRENPDYDYWFFDDEDRRELIREHFDDDVSRAYEKLEFGALRADLWRYCALYVHGGVYADVDFVCLSPLREVFRPSDEFVTSNAHAPAHALLNGFIASVPGHPFLEQAIRRAVENVFSDTPKQPMAVTGPICFGEAVNLALGRDATTPFDDGTHLINGVSFRLLIKVHAKDRSEHRVADGHRTVLQCKYPGYESDLRAVGLEHWQARVARQRRSHISHWYGAFTRRVQRLRRRIRP